jgi:dihydrofolate synthase/folylpolyglutamate synthase
MSLFQKYLPAEKHFDVVGSSNMREMLKLSRDELSEGTLLVIVGSLYMAGEILGYEEFFD